MEDKTKVKINVPTKKNDVPPDPNQLYMYFEVIFAIVIVNVVIGVLFVIITFSFDFINKPEAESTIQFNTAKYSNYEYKLYIKSREEWLAAPAHKSLDKLLLPVHRVVITHSATENCSSQAMCTYRIRDIQNFHMNYRNFSDIAYNFLVGGDGNVYEGRGWDQQGIYTKGYNADSIGIAFIGTFTTESPPEGQLNAAKLLLEEGVRLNKLVKDYRLYGARQLSGTESPGRVLYAIIQKWPNWSPSI